MPPDPGPAGPGPAERARLAAEALARAREDARARGEGVPADGARAAGRAAGSQRARGRPREGGQAPPAEPAGESGVPGAPAASGTAAAAKKTPPPGRATGRAGRPRRARRDDPEPLRAAIGGLLDARGWRDDLAVGGLFGRWDQIVGADLAAHTRPEAFTAGELLVTADSTTWATQVRLLAATLVARVNAELGGPVVLRVKVRGPAPPPPSGPWRVRGGRGPRGDYG